VEHKYAPDQDIKVKVTDFGLSRNPDAEYMTSALGTLVNDILLCSIGWHHNYYKTDHTHQKLTYIHMELCFGRYVRGQHLIEK
jgi:hypothetical protein